MAVTIRGGRELRARLKAVRLVFKDVGRKWGDRAADRMRPRVPTKTGRLRRSFKVNASQTRARVRAHYSAFFVDAGTQRHTITPKRGKVLRFETHGDTIFARKVVHPATRARPFRAEAASRAFDETVGVQTIYDAWNHAA